MEQNVQLSGNAYNQFLDDLSEGSDFLIGMRTQIITKVALKNNIELPQRINVRENINRAYSGE